MNVICFFGGITLFGICSAMSRDTRVSHVPVEFLEDKSLSVQSVLDIETDDKKELLAVNEDCVICWKSADLVVPAGRSFDNAVNDDKGDSDTITEWNGLWSQLIIQPLFHSHLLTTTMSRMDENVVHDAHQQ